MRWLTALFLIALAGETGTRWWLAARQINAVRAHRDQVPGLFHGQIALADQQRAADYTVARTRLGQYATLYEALLKVLMTLGGGLAAVDALLRPLPWPEPWHGAVLLLTVLVFLQLLGLPFALWRTFRIEARFGFNRMTVGLFAADLGKQLLLAILLGGPLALATLALMEKAGAWWWAWAWLVWVGATLALTWAAPRFIAPLFNRFSPVSDAALKLRVEALLERCGFTARGGVYVMDGSRRSAHGNAYFTGIGRNKRIVFFDTLLARINLDEIAAVLAHELGHFRLHHVRQRLGVATLSVLLGLALLGWLAGSPAFIAPWACPASLRQWPFCSSFWSCRYLHSLRHRSSRGGRAATSGRRMILPSNTRTLPTLPLRWSNCIATTPPRSRRTRCIRRSTIPILPPSSASQP